MGSHRGEAVIRTTVVAGDDTWMAQARCAAAGPAAMFPAAEVDQEDAAQAHCAGCPVRMRCLEYALDNSIDHGVWGGHTEGQRRQLRRQMRKGRSLAAALTPPAPKPRPRRISERRQAVLDLAAEHPDGLTAGVVADRLGCTRGAASRRLFDLEVSGQLRRIKYGVYALAEELARV